MWTTARTSRSTKSRRRLTLLPFLKSDGHYVIEDVHRYPKPDGPDDPSGIMKKIPKEYDCRLIRTGPRDDDVMIWINRREQNE